jgi:predicted ATPase/DNA-binding SARP family transcriptional activator
MIAATEESREQKGPRFPSGSLLATDLAPFVGRVRDLEALREALSERRLVTLTGFGGTGKTRLALEVARHLRLTQPVAVAELAGVGDGAFLLARVARGFGVDQDPSGISRIADVIPQTSTLLVLDNCEHLTEACGALIMELFSLRPKLRVMATSREALGVPGERVWPVGPLPCEGPSSDATQLLIDRARDLAPGFEVTEENAHDLSEISRKLEGIPLALELAAARLKVLTPRQILERLDDMHSLLRVGGRGPHHRHRTLSATLRWSYEQLDPDAQAIFRRLSVFRGGFGLRAVEAIGAAGPDAARALSEASVLDALEQLIDRSLITVRELGGENRYGMLEPLRQLAAAELSGDPAEEAATCRAHAAEVLALANEVEPHLLTVRRRTWIVRFARELDNLRAALRRTRGPLPALHAELAAAAWWFWFSSRHWTEARRWLEDAGRIPPSEMTRETWGRLHFALGALDALQARPASARPRLETAIAVAAETGNERARAYGLNYLGMAHAQEGRPEAFEILEEARSWFEEHEDLYGLRLNLLLLATSQGAAGQAEAAILTAERAVGVARVFGQDRELAVASQTLGGLHLREGDDSRARELFLESLRGLLRDPADMFTARALHLLGVIAGREGNVEEAGRLIGMAETLRERIEAPPFELDRALIEAEVSRIVGGADAEVFEWARGKGRKADVEEAVRRICSDTAATGGADGASVEPAPARSAPTVVALAPAVQIDLAVHALGPLRVSVFGQPLDDVVWSYAKPRELLVFLAAHPAGRTRDEIASALWPDTPPDRLKNSFHVTLHHLRKALGDSGWVVIDRDRYRIPENRSMSLDLDVFTNGVERLPCAADTDEDRELYRAVLDLYRGDFLEGAHGTRWHEPIADRARRLYAEAALRLAHGFENAGRWEEAGEAYQRLVAVDELNEKAQRGLMNALARSGQRAHALRQFERLRALLERELGACPEPETVALRDALRGTVEPI